MSEIGEKAEKICLERYEKIKRKPTLNELKDEQARCYINRILDVFAASNEEEDKPCYVSTVIVSYDEDRKKLYCRIKLKYENSEKTNEKSCYVIISNKKVRTAMENVNACQASDCGIITRIYNLLVADPQVTKYFEVTLSEDGVLVIKMRPQKEVMHNETICENEEPA